MKRDGTVTLFLCGDVMTGRGIDQILPRPSDPQLFESYVEDARQYVALAEERSGPIPRSVDDSYIWGDVLDELQQATPDVRIVNLETSVTKSGEWWLGKGIHYRMHPDNVRCLTAASIDCCVLANNHVLDWGYPGLEETLVSLNSAGIRTAGAGRDIREAELPAIFDVQGGGRVLVFAYGSRTSGIPREWAATVDEPGLSLITDRPAEDAEQIASAVKEFKWPGDIVVASIHWGGNWGYTVPSAQRELAHLLIDEAGVDVIHGHSSHHPKGIEIHSGKPIIYGCGDFLNDYEGIAGYEEYRPDLSLMYFVTIECSAGELTGLDIRAMSIDRFRLRRASRGDTLWLKDTLSRESRRLGAEVELTGNGTLRLRGRAEPESSARLR